MTTRPAPEWRGVRAGQADAAPVVSVPGRSPVSSTAATQRELARNVEAAIHQLNDQDREIILMRHYEHLSNLEIAEVLGLNPPAASMRYLRAVRRLRQLLEEQSPEQGDGATVRSG